MSEIELHRKLLGDKVRNDALHAALSRAIRPGCTVADLGAGTGFLSFLARRLGAAHCHLYEYSGALALGRDLARANRVTGLSFVEAHSTEVRKPPKADVVVSETLGNFALEEGLLETLVDARRFLARGGTLIPRALAQYVAPVVDARVQREIDVWPDVGHGLDFGAARAIALNNMYVRTLAPAELGGPARRWDHVEFAPPARAPSSERSGHGRWTARELAGKAVHGFALWWEAELVPGVMLSTAPDAPPTHWEQVYLPLSQPLQPAGDDAVTLELRSDTRRGVRVVWEAAVLRGGRAVGRQRHDLARGRL
jgi:SAM-dependent methyltransferase